MLPRVLLSLPVLVIVLAAPLWGASGEAMSLAGVHKFAPGDDPRWAAPEFADAQWRAINVPGGWQAQGIPARVTQGWYRLHFTVPAQWSASELAVALGVIGNADEVFLNGVRIGGEGVIGARAVEAPVERLYRLPAGLLNFGRDNLLAVRVLNTYSTGGLFSGPVAIGAFHELALGVARRESAVIALESGVIAFLVFALLFCGLFFGRNLQRREAWFFWLSFVMFAVVFVIDSRLFYRTGWKTVALQQLDYLLIIFLPAGALLFLAQAYESGVTKPVQAVAAVFPLLALGLVCAPDFTWAWLVNQVWIVNTALAAGLMVWLAWRGWRRRLPGAGIILAGTAVSLAGLLIEFLGPGEWRQLNGVLISLVTSTFPLLALLLAVAARSVDARERLRAVSEKLLVAQEEERRRLARELHDGVGQSLLAVKLHLQMMRASAQSGGALAMQELGKLIDSLAEALGELRQAVTGLRPSFLDEMNLAEAMQRYGAAFEQQTGLAVTVQAPAELEAVAQIEDHLFRIFQEALSNARKHAQARQVEVRLQPVGTRLRLEIRDDGCGFAVEPALRRGAGLGLATIRERAELLGGFCHIASAPGAGTTIVVEVQGHA
jgi:signal transduction histidine kinase